MGSDDDEDSASGRANTAVSASEFIENEAAIDGEDVGASGEEGGDDDEEPTSSMADFIVDDEVEEVPEDPEDGTQASDHSHHSLQMRAELHAKKRDRATSEDSDDQSFQQAVRRRLNNRTPVTDDDVEGTAAGATAVADTDDAPYEDPDVVHIPPVLAAQLGHARSLKEGSSASSRARHADVMQRLGMNDEDDDDDDEDTEKNMQMDRNQLPDASEDMYMRLMASGEEIFGDCDHAWPQFVRLYDRINNETNLELCEEAELLDYMKQLWVIWKDLGKVPLERMLTVACEVISLDLNNCKPIDSNLEPMFNELKLQGFVERQFKRHFEYTFTLFSILVARENGDPNPNMTSHHRRLTRYNNLYYLICTVIATMKQMVLHSINMLAAVQPSSNIPKINGQMVRSMFTSPFGDVDAEEELDENGKKKKARDDTDFYKLLQHVLDMAFEKRLRYSGDEVYKPHNIFVTNSQGQKMEIWTGTFEPFYKITNNNPTSPLTRFISELFSDSTHPDLERLHGQTAGNTTRLSEFIKEANKPKFPRLEVDRYWVAFRNGVYHLKHDDFYDYLTRPIPQSITACHFIDMDFPILSHRFNQHMYEPWNDNELNTPTFDKIFLHQKMGSATDPVMQRCVLRWIYSMLGRYLYWVGEFDDWQVCLMLYGQAGTGKSTVWNVIRKMLPSNRVTEVTSDAQREFGFQFLVDDPRPFVALCAELKKEATISQAAVQTMVSGDPMQIVRKNKSAFNMQRNVVPIGFAGNEIPYGWRDAGGSLGRRLVMVHFTHVVSPDDKVSNLAEKIEKEELAKLMVKLNRCYRIDAARLKAQNKQLWSALPQYFVEGQRILRAATNNMTEFLESPSFCNFVAGGVYSSDVNVIKEIAAKGYIVRYADFMAKYREWAKSQGHNVQVKFNEVLQQVQEKKCQIVEQLEIQYGASVLTDKFIVGMHLTGFQDADYNASKGRRTTATAAAATGASNNNNNNHLAVPVVVSADQEATDNAIADIVALVEDENTAATTPQALPQSAAQRLQLTSALHPALTPSSGTPRRFGLAHKRLASAVDEGSDGTNGANESSRKKQAHKGADVRKSQKHAAEDQDKTSAASKRARQDQQRPTSTHISPFRPPPATARPDPRNVSLNDDDNAL